MKNNNIYRLHYRGQLKEAISGQELAEALALCEENVRQAQKENKIMTAALYYHNNTLFLYYEAVGSPAEIQEPLTAEGGLDGINIESGEDIQAQVIRPDSLLTPLNDFLQPWPGQNGNRLWVHMYHIYYHSIPESPQQWKRTAIPEMRRGRIAFLREDKLFSYVYWHKAIVDEGLLLGDKYQSIALHENILFSYFEEPRVQANVRGDFETPSKVIDEWTAVDPESHFIHMPQGNGGNFMFLPAYFALGTEEEVGK